MDASVVSRMEWCYFGFGCRVDTSAPTNESTRRQNPEEHRYPLHHENLQSSIEWGDLFSFGSERKKNVQVPVLMFAVCLHQIFFPFFFFLKIHALWETVGSQIFLKYVTAEIMKLLMNYGIA
jgi:hypothetical protein